MLSKTFQSESVSYIVSQLNIDWRNVYSSFIVKFNNVYKSCNRKLHFDYIRSETNARCSQIDGAKENWIDIILLDTIICILNDIRFLDHRYYYNYIIFIINYYYLYIYRSKRRSFMPKKALIESIIEAIDMDESNIGWDIIIKEVNLFNFK